MSFCEILCEEYIPSSHTEPATSLKDHVDIWLLRVSSYLPYLEEISANLSYEEIKKSGKYHHLKDVRAYRIRHGLRRLLTAKYLSVRPNEIQFGTAGNKKPIIIGSNVGIHFNSSHSNDLILLAFSTTEVGIDVEHVRTDFAYDDVLNHSFSPTEISIIQKSAHPRKAFFKLWTRKEALLKASGKGLDDDLPSVPSIDGTHNIQAELLGCHTDWNVRSFLLSNSYVASVAHTIGLKPHLMVANGSDLLSPSKL